jgi:N-methylhydantoinase A
MNDHADTSQRREIHVGVDVGGTFTDLTISVLGESRQIQHKLPSTPDQPDRAIIDGIRQALELNGLDAGDIGRLAHGTTVGTNALIQRKIGKVAIVAEDGFRDLIEIGRQTRPKVYDIHTDHPKPLVPRELRLEVRGRVLADGTVRVPLSEEDLLVAAEKLAKAEVDCVVVCFLNSYAYPDHEQAAVEILKRRLGDRVHVLSSSGLHPEFREYERYSTAVLNGALLTVMNDYLNRFTTETAGLGVAGEPRISQSSGGLMSVEMARAEPIRASLSGPAAGVIGAGKRASAAGFGNVITLDVGGTSADVSLLADGSATEVMNRELGGFPLRMPALDVNAVGAGGGSIAWIDRDGLLKVGPQSAGAEPGPACYDLGGQSATVTDANVVLGRLHGETLLGGRMAIKKTLAESAIGGLADVLGMEADETALGIIRVTCAVMVRAIRSISVERGHNPRDFSLFAFGGAGPLHAVEVASQLDISRVIIPPNPGVLCAEGLLHSDLRQDFVRTVLLPLEPERVRLFESVRLELLEEAVAWFAEAGIEPPAQKLDWVLDLRYVGQNFELTMSLPEGPITEQTISDLISAFHGNHEVSYGFASETERVEFVNFRVKALGDLVKPEISALGPAGPARPTATRPVRFRNGGWFDTPIYERNDLGPGQAIDGPAIIEQLDTTTIVRPTDVCRTDAFGNLIITIGGD